MQQIFVPKSHVIHFDPHDHCPEGEDPQTSPKWNNLTRECQRSDSVCLVSPIEVITVFDGSKEGLTLDKDTTITTYGLLRGCASRRKLLENEPTIRFKVNLNSNFTPDDTKKGSLNAGQVFNVVNPNESNADLSSRKFDDGYVINKVYSHEFFIDQWTDSATRCIQDNCNTRVKVKSGSRPTTTSASSFELVILSSICSVLYNLGTTVISNKRRYISSSVN